MTLKIKVLLLLGIFLIPADNTFLVLAVNDGDTLVIDMNGPKTIRLLGVDTPETHHPTKPVQCYGPQASEYLKRLEGERISIVSDTTSYNKDQYNRLLRYIYFKGENINMKIVEQGYGFASLAYPSKHVDEFKILESKASRENKGLWGKCTVELNNGFPATQALSLLILDEKT
mgnify:CR=1 FL=1